MNRIVEVVNIQNPNDLIVRQAADAQAHLIGEENPPDFNLHVAKRGQNVDELGHHNLTRAVEQILNYFGFNVGYTNQPFFVLAFPEYI